MTAGQHVLLSTRAVCGPDLTVNLNIGERHHHDGKALHHDMAA